MTIKTRYESEYIEWIGELKNRIKNTQIRAALSANKEIIDLYWAIGKDLFEKQESQGWGNSIIKTIEMDLASEFPNLKGFSRRNLFYMKEFNSFYKSDIEKVQQLVAQIPWGHNILIFSKSRSINESLFYLIETVKFHKVVDES